MILSVTREDNLTAIFTESRFDEIDFWVGSIVLSDILYELDNGYREGALIETFNNEEIQIGSWNLRAQG